MAVNSLPGFEPENTRIIRGRYFARIFIEDSVSGPVFHWTICLLDRRMLIALGEQSSYEIACQEAQHHLSLLVEADELAEPRALEA